ncbi:MAG: DUF5977 domain-containing protein [Bacteroidota bacterium]|nr:DUF5977 domain-containing protein [Bacteroidota bacterium]
MKKIFLLFSILTCFFTGYSQSLTTTNTTINSGGTVTLTGSGEAYTATSGKYFDAFKSQSVNSVSPAPYGIGNVTLSNVSITYFNKTSKAATVIVDKLVSNAPVPVTVNFEVSIAGYDNSTQKSTAPQTFTFSITVNPAPASFGNVAMSPVFIKNSCGVGFIGSKVTYTVPKDTYHASTQNAANQLAQNDINANGQNYANANGTCTAGYYNQAQFQPFTRNNCTVGTNPTTVTYTVNENTYTGATQTAANQLALNDIAANGQAYANAHGVCTTIYAALVSIATPDPLNTGNYTEKVQIQFFSNPDYSNPLQVSTTVTFQGPVAEQSSNGGHRGAVTYKTETQTIVANNVNTLTIPLNFVFADVKTSQSPSSLGFTLVASPTYTILNEKTF